MMRRGGPSAAAYRACWRNAMLHRHSSQAAAAWMAESDGVAGMGAEGTLAGAEHVNQRWQGVGHGHGQGLPGGQSCTWIDRRFNVDEAGCPSGVWSGPMSCHVRLASFPA